MATRARLVYSSAQALRRCTRTFAGARLDEIGVERIGVSGGSVTFRQSGAPWVFGCDRIVSPAEALALRPWCGGAAGQTFGGRLRDLRLRFCADRKGTPTAFAWIEPLPAARWIVVRDGSLREVYAVAASLPVRVSTTHDVFVEQALALFHVAQYAADGRRLSSRTFKAVVAG